MSEGSGKEREHMGSDSKKNNVNLSGEANNSFRPYDYLTDQLYITTGMLTGVATVFATLGFLMAAPAISSNIKGIIMFVAATTPLFGMIAGHELYGHRHDGPNF